MCLGHRRDGDGKRAISIPPVTRRVRPSWSLSRTPHLKLDLRADGRGRTRTAALHCLGVERMARWNGRRFYNRNTVVALGKEERTGLVHGRQGSFGRPFFTATARALQGRKYRFANYAEYDPDPEWGG